MDAADALIHALGRPARLAWGVVAWTVGSIATWYWANRQLRNVIDVEIDTD